MANYGNKYRIDFSNVDGDNFQVFILQKEYVGQVYTLPAAADPLIIKYRDNGETIYPAIKGSEATVRFISTGAFDILTVISDDDTEFKVEAYAITGTLPTELPNLIWAGFIDSYSCREELLDDPRIVELKANDGLSLLKNQEFRDEAGDTIYSKESIISLLYYCIYNTGIHDLELMVDVNVFEETQFTRDTDPISDAFLQTKIHTRSFIKERDEFQNCYTVLESIMSAFNATMFQANGKWYVVRFPDKWNVSETYATRYLWPWASAADAVQYVFSKDVDLITTIPINADHTRAFLPPAKKGEVTFQYDISPEIPRNSSFRQGAYDPTYSDADEKVYAIDYWRYENGTVSSPTVITSVAPYRKEVYELDNTYRKRLEDEYIILGKLPSGDDASKRLLHEDTIDLSIDDIFTFSIQTRVKNNYTGPGSVNIAYIIIYGDSGQKYTLQDDGSWTPTANSALGSGVTISITTDEPAGEWRTVTRECDQLPETGRLGIWLMEWAQTSPNETYFKDLQLSFYIPNGLTGEKATVSQQLKLRENEQRTVVCGSAPTRVVSGALVRDDIVGNQLCTYWFRFGITEQKRMSEILALDLFRARKRLKTKVDGTIKNVVMAVPGEPTYNTIISPITQFTYSKFPSYNYLASSMDISVENNTARLYLMEFYNTDFDNPLEEGDETDFKYLN